MKTRLLTYAIVASLTGLTGGAMSATADAPYQAAAQLTSGSVNSDDYKLGIAQLQERLASGDGRAAMMLANLLLTKEKHLQDSTVYAIELYRRATELGAAGADLQLATTLMRQGLDLGTNTAQGRESLAEARTLFQGLASNPDNTEANWNLGFMETRGLPADADFPAGVAHIRVAADAGHPMAAYWMASYLDQLGRGAKPERLEYLRVAAAKNHFLAKQDLAKLQPQSASESMIASTAKGVVQDAWSSLSKGASDLVTSINLKEAVTVASLGATPPPTAPRPKSAPQPQPTVVQGPSLTAAATASITTAALPTAEEIRQERDVLQASLTRTQIELNQVRQQLAKATQDQILLPSSLNQQGLAAVMENDYETALAKFREAAKFDYAPAIANLGLLYLNGTAVPQDGKQAIALFKRASALGNVTAAENAGRAYDYGIGIHRSRYRAIEWYEKAIGLGSQHAAAAIARLKAEP